MRILALGMRPYVKPVRLCRGLLLLGILAWCAMASRPSQAYTGVSEHTLGYVALRTGRGTSLWMVNDLALVDGKVKTSPPDTVKLDRRLETEVGGGGAVFFGPRMGLRLDLKGSHVRRREEDAEEPKSTRDAEYTNLGVAMDLLFVTDKGLELFAGVAAEQLGSYQETIDTVNIDFTTKFGAVTLLSRRLGVLRRAGLWSGGFYYAFGDEGSRSFAKQASDGSTAEGKYTVLAPPKVGVFGQVRAAPGEWDFEFAFAQARGKGPRDDAGKTLYTDYFDASLGMMLGDGGGLRARLAAYYRSLAYGNSANISLDTIPVATLRAQAYLGDAKNHFFAGVFYGIGQDGQSLPEFNATYAVGVYGATLGLGSQF